MTRDSIFEETVIDSMRLDREQRQALPKAIEDVQGEVYLFGSRVDKSRKGGDINFLIISGEDAYALSKRVRRQFVERCDEKLDVVVMDPEHLSKEQAAFLNISFHGRRASILARVCHRLSISKHRLSATTRRG